TPSGHQASCGYDARAAIFPAGSDKHRRRRMFRPAAGDVRARNARDAVAVDGRALKDVPIFKMLEFNKHLTDCSFWRIDFQSSHYCCRIYRRMTPEDNSTRSTLTYPHGFGEKIMNVALAGYVGPACRKVKLHSGSSLTPRRP
ncbi:hypothetical protein ALC57_07688, partial [Trachymyrmex cornetzi]